MTDIYLSMQAIFSGDNSDYLNLFVILGILSNVARQDCCFNADFVFFCLLTALLVVHQDTVLSRPQMRPPDEFSISKLRS